MKRIEELLQEWWGMTEEGLRAGAEVRGKWYMLKDGEREMGDITYNALEYEKFEKHILYPIVAGGEEVVVRWVWDNNEEGTRYLFAIAVYGEGDVVVSAMFNGERLICPHTKDIAYNDLFLYDTRKEVGGGYRVEDFWKELVSRKYTV